MASRAAALALLSLAGASIAAHAATAPNQVTREEVIGEVSRFTGLGKDAVSLAVRENPKLLEGLDECVLAVKIVNQFADAQDSAALVEIGGWVLGKLKDRLVPAGVGSLLTAVSVYKSALEALRDYTFIPAFESSLYRKYANARREDARRGDTSRESMTTAFETATTAWFSGYPALKQRMFDRMVKAKGYNAGLMGPALERELWRKIDDYWIACFEARLQQELLRENRIGVIARLWAVEGRRLAALAGSSPGRDAREGFFFTERDLPAGWKLYRSKAQDGLGIQRRPEWLFLMQSFALRPANLSEQLYQGGSAVQYRTSAGQHTQVIYNRVTVRIYRNLQPLADGTPWTHGDFLTGQLSRNECVTFSGSRLLGPFEDAGVDAGLLAYDGTKAWDVRWSIAFAKGDHYAEVEFGGAPPADIEKRRAEEARRVPDARYRSHVADSPVSKEMALYFAHVVASKMPGRR